MRNLCCKHFSKHFHGLLLTMIVNTGPGVKPAEYLKSIPVHITAALMMAGKPLTLHHLGLLTKHHPDSIAKYIKALVEAGIVTEVPQATCRYVLAEKGGK